MHTWRAAHIWGWHNAPGRIAVMHVLARPTHSTSMSTSANINSRHRADQGSSDGMRWICSVRLLFTFQFRGTRRQAAFVHWLETCPLPSRRRGAKAKEVEAHKALGMQRLRWQLVNSGGDGTNSDSSASDREDSSEEGRHRPAARSGDHLCCVIDADDFDRPVFIQADPTAEGHFYWNHHVR